ncbi:MAG: transposase, partial [Bacillota bacterium]|nr:transposase [Bacillota bacterium]
KKDVLDTSYFHCVFTVPKELNNLFLSNQHLLYTLLFNASAETMNSLGAEKKYLGAKIGFISLLHTFGSNLSYHPHIHMILIGGGLTDALKFKPSKSNDFLFPARVIAGRFRNLFLKGLESLFELKQLVFTKNTDYLLKDSTFKKFLISLKKKHWNINIKETLHGAHNAIEYLGRYTHRIAISNNRIISVTDDQVTFKYKSYKSDGEMKIMSLHPIEFIRRFTMHILPPGFIKMRHYGILSNRSKKKTFMILKNVLRNLKQKSELEGLNTREILLKVFKIDIYKCQICSSTNLSEGPLVIKRE